MTFPLPRLKGADAYNLADITNNIDTEYNIREQEFRLMCQTSISNRGLDK